MNSLRYFDLEKARLDERLQVEWGARVEDYLDQLVPTLILQPIVENAVIHGIATKPKGGTVHITISQYHDLLQAARARQETEDFKVVYRQHRGGGEAVCRRWFADPACVRNATSDKPRGISKHCSPVQL